MSSYLRLLTEKSSNITTPPTGHTALYASSGTAGESQYQLYIKDPTGQSTPVGGFASGATYSGNVTFMSGGTFYSGGYATSGTDTTALVVFGDISGATSGTCYFNRYSSSSPLEIQAGAMGENDNIYLQPDFVEGMDKNVAIHVPFSAGTYSGGGNYYGMLEHSLTVSGATSGTSSIGYGTLNTFTIANNTAVFNSGNTVSGIGGFAIGGGNNVKVSSDYGFAGGIDSISSGITINSPSTTLGRFNAWSSLLTVGAGSGTTTGANAAANAGRINVCTITESGATFGRHYRVDDGDPSAGMNRYVALGIVSGASQVAAANQTVAQGFNPGLQLHSADTANIRQYVVGNFGNLSNTAGDTHYIPEGTMTYDQFAKTLAIWTGGTAWARVSLSAITSS
tara:strand:+ start:1198 stop:2382 length:1185 start_codon:yes stop_codon:yes gene_type:complete